MTELKTLNGIEGMCACGSHHDDSFVSKDNLRAEAIKWVKQLQIAEDKGFTRVDDTGLLAPFFVPVEDVEPWDGKCVTASNVIKWIKHFFGISEDETK